MRFRMERLRHRSPSVRPDLGHEPLHLVQEPGLDKNDQTNDTETLDDVEYPIL